MVPYKYFIISLCLVMIMSQQNSFRFHLEKNQEECLFDYFPDKTLVIYEVYTSNVTIRVVLKNPEQKVLESQQTTFFKYPFTTYSGGYYEICISNGGNYTTPVHFTLKYGVAAKDYSSVARTKDLKPIDLELEKLSDRTKYLSHYANFAKSHEQIFETSLESISGKIVFFSSILIAMMIVIGGMETFYLKKFMERRKII